MEQTAIQVGLKVRIISQGDVCYEGTPVQINMDGQGDGFFSEDGRVLLCDVYCNLEGMNYIPLLSFKTTDIKHIELLEPIEKGPLYFDACAFQYSNMTSFSSPYGYSSVTGCGYNSFERLHYPFADKFFPKNSRINKRNFPSNVQGRMPQLKTFSDSSGDPKELKMVGPSVETKPFEQDYDFDKFNKLFNDICDGFADFDVSAVSNDANKTDTTVTSNSDNNSSDSIGNATTSKGAIPKKIVARQQLPQQQQQQQQSAVQSTAYDKSKSFFDKISNSFGNRSIYLNPNWREKNIETFGSPMIFHDHRIRRYSKYPTELPKVAEEDENFSIQKASYAEVLKYGKNFVDINGKQVNNNHDHDPIHELTQLNFENSRIQATSTPLKENPLIGNINSQPDLLADLHKADTT